MTTFEQFDRSIGPHRPLAEQTADNAPLDHVAVPFKTKSGEEVDDDVVVVSRVERDIVPAGLDDRTNDVQRLVAIKRSDFDRNNVFNFHKASPEIIRKKPAAREWLQIESNHRNEGCESARVVNELIFGCLAQRTETEQTAMKTGSSEEFGLSKRLRRLTTDAANADKIGGCGAVEFGTNEFEKRLEKTGLADRKLSCVDAHRKSAGSGRQVVPDQRVLSPFVDFSIGGECQRTGGYHLTEAQGRGDERRELQAIFISRHRHGSRNAWDVPGSALRV